MKNMNEQIIVRLPAALKRDAERIGNHYLLGISGLTRQLLMEKVASEQRLLKKLKRAEHQAVQ